MFGKRYIRACSMHANIQTLEIQIDLLGAICPADINPQKYDQHPNMMSHTT